MLRSAALAFSFAVVLAGPSLGRHGSQPPGDAFGAPRPDSAGATITGLVTSRGTGTPLTGASVYVEGTMVGTTTAGDGRFTLAIPARRLHGQTMTVIARRIGFTMGRKSLVPRAGVTDTLDFALDASPMRLGEVVVTGTGAPPMALPASLASADELVIVEAPGSAPVPAPVVGYTGVRTALRSTAAAVKAAAGTVGRASLRQAEADAVAPIAPPTQGALRARDAAGGVIGELPLDHTEVNAEISGSLAQTTVEQRYTNPYERAIEAVYVFPLPSMAAVNGFVMRVGGRKIVGVVRPRDEAERIYREARARGQTASLLTQERPNIFTQNVANIAPGEAVTIHITYFETLPYEHGEYSYVFPMVVGPRYIPGGARPPHDALVVSRRPRHGGGGWARPTDQVPDADRITPPVLAPGQRSGHDIALTVTLDAGLPITTLDAVAHEVEIERPSTSRNVIHLMRSDSIPNRDFVLRWSVAGAETQFGVLAHRDERGGYFTLTMQPPLEPGDEDVTPRELTFILDVSGSMMGEPITIAKDVVLRTLDKLRPGDLFNIVYFASGNAQLWERPRPGTRENIAEAKNFLASLRAGGGTEMLAGVRRALSARHEPGDLRMFVFLTDGYVGNEEEILRVVKEERGDARFFAFGIGSSVNRYLIDGIGEHGGGSSFTVIPRDPDHSRRAVSRLFDAIDSPVLVDVHIDWNGLPVEDVFPGKLRDLFAGQTINVIGRYTRGARGTAYVTGRVGERRVRYPVRVELPEAEPEHPALAPMWARHEIHELSTAMLAADSAERVLLEQRITNLAMQFRIVSRYTAFVAVDESRIVGDGRPLRIVQPVELPEGVSYEGIFGEQPVGVPVRIGAWGLDVQGTESGRVRVGGVARDGAGARAGVRRGAVVRSVNDVPIHDVGELERVLLQSGGERAVVQLEPGGRAVLPMP